MRKGVGMGGGASVWDVHGTGASWSSTRIMVKYYGQNTQLLRSYIMVKTHLLRSNPGWPPAKYYGQIYGQDTNIMVIIQPRRHAKSADAVLDQNRHEE